MTLSQNNYNWNKFDLTKNPVCDTVEPVKTLNEANTHGLEFYLRVSARVYKVCVV